MRPWQAGGLESFGLAWHPLFNLRSPWAEPSSSAPVRGRVEYEPEWYGKGLELCDNFYVLASGGVTLRPGRRNLRARFRRKPHPQPPEARASASLERGARARRSCISARMVASDERTKDGAGRKTRLIPFVFNAAEAYALLFTDKAMRVIRDGGLVTGEDGEPFVLALPYVESALADLRGAQSAGRAVRGSSRLSACQNHALRSCGLALRGADLPLPAGAARGRVRLHSTGPTDKSRVTYSYKVTAYDGETGEESEASAAVSVVRKIWAWRTP